MTDMNDDDLAAIEQKCETGCYVWLTRRADGEIDSAVDYDVPRLLAEVRRLRAELEEFKAGPFGP